MMRLLPGDQLWDRYRVDHVGADPLAGAWLSVLRPDKGADADSAPHFLLIPLENSGRHALSEILALTVDVARLNKSSRGKTRKIRARRPANAERETGGWTDVPLLGPVEWLGEPAQGGVAIVHASPGTTLSSSVHAARSLAPAQALHVAVNLSAALSDLQEMLIEPDAGQYRADQVLRAMARLLHPEGLVLRTGDGKPNVPRPPRAAGSGQAVGAAAVGGFSSAGTLPAQRRRLAGVAGLWCRARGGVQHGHPHRQRRPAERRAGVGATGGLGRWAPRSGARVPRCGRGNGRA
jgi:hypothetical protein